MQRPTLRRAVPFIAGPDGAVQTPATPHPCAACGVASTALVPVPDGTDDPPMVCDNFRLCCRQYRRGLSPDVFGAMVSAITRSRPA